MKLNNAILSPSQTTLGAASHVPSSPGMPAKGDSHPPRKNTEVSAATRIMFAYSARKNSANPMPEYSTWKPATISDSPSATSNGCRFVSATPAMKYTMNSGKSGSQNQLKTLVPACDSTIWPRFKLPAAISTPTSAKPIAISYATICAAERIAPRNAYFEFDAQPARITPYTPSDVNARTYSSPASMFAMTKSSLSGTTAHTAKAGTSETMGAITNRKRFELVGMTTSLNIILNRSANGCSSPRNPTRFGPRRCWMKPMILRSAYVKYATPRIRGTITTTIFSKITAMSRTISGSMSQ